ncbi:MAG: serine/threonine-protein kinase [Polyangiaceae bacterium]
MTEVAAGGLIGQYRVVDTLGAGGMGVVYLAEALQGGEPRALKVMRKEMATPEGTRRFLREARATMALAHPNVISVFETFEDQGLPVMVMEVLRGVTLADYLLQERKLSLEEACGIFLRVTSALGTAHSLGLVHRDLKPENVYLLEDAPYVKLIDFGIAKLTGNGLLRESGVLTKTGALVGTPFYMAPEQAFGERSIDHRADGWSLGMMLYETLTGILPTREKTLELVFRHFLNGAFPRVEALEPTVEPAVADMIHALLSIDPSQRPADLRPIFEVLGRYAPDIGDNVPTFGPPISVAQRATEPAQQATPAAPGAGAAPLRMTPAHLKLRR